MDTSSVNSALSALEAYENEAAFQREHQIDRDTHHQMLVELQNQNHRLEDELAQSRKNNRKMLFWTIFNGCWAFIGTAVAIFFGVLNVLRVG